MDSDSTAEISHISSQIQLSCKQFELYKSMLKLRKMQRLTRTKNVSEIGSKTSEDNSDQTSKEHTATDKVLESPVEKSDTMLEKLEKAAPYNIFYNKVLAAPETKNQENAIYFTDLLCPSLGVLKCSLQINQSIDILWLLYQYKERGLSSKPLTILYCNEPNGMEEDIPSQFPNVTTKIIEVEGYHHAKIGIYVYEDNSIRIVVLTSDLIFTHWNNINAGLWVSPLCKRLPDSCSEKDGDSPTHFKRDLLSYLRSYREPTLSSFIEYVQKADFSAVRVFLIYSAPGSYYPGSNGSHLHAVADLLFRHCTLPAQTPTGSGARTEGPLAWTILAQTSNFGTMDKWFHESLLRCLSTHKDDPKPIIPRARICIVYPTVENARTGYFGDLVSPYSKDNHENQRWLENYMYQWKAESYGRTGAMPFIKTYCRVSPCFNKLAYFLLTSANTTRSAWGSGFGNHMQVYVRSYEAGVLFLPSFFDEEFFEIKSTEKNKNKRLFPFMYDLPLTPYRSSDYPWSAV